MANVDELSNEKNIFFDDINRHSVIKERKLQPDSPVDVIPEGKPNDHVSGSPLTTKCREKEVSSSSEGETEVFDYEDTSTQETQHFLKNHDFAYIEKEINVLVKLRCLVKVDKNTREHVGKAVTSVECESMYDSLPGSPRRSREGSPDKTGNSIEENRHKKPKFSPVSEARSLDSSSCSSQSYEKSELTKRNKWKNINLLMTTMINFADTKLHEIASSEGYTRPRERIRFSTPEVERKYRKIVREATRGRDTSSSCTDRASNCHSNPSRKRKCSDIFIEPPEILQQSEAQLSASLGPIPEENSKLFQGMSFILTYVSRDFMDPYQLETMETLADAENEEQWNRRPFLRERLIEQLKAGGGEVYESFELVPTSKYETTMLITNMPNLTAKSLLCLSVGIKAYNHQWVIRCCQERKFVNPAEEQLPAGWSLIKQTYIEMFERPSQKPFLYALPVVVVIPVHPAKRQFVSLWGKICKNAGAAVLYIKEPSQDFMKGSVVLTHNLCPPWLTKKAKDWDIPLVSTRWAIQSLIEGHICSYDAHPSFEYNCVRQTSYSTCTA